MATRSGQGVTDVIDLRRADVAEPWEIPGPGLVCTNPPFGRRVEHGANLAAVYRALGASVDAAGPGWRGCLVTDDRRRARDTSLRLVPALTTDHGGLKVDFMVAARATKTRR